MNSLKKILILSLMSLAMVVTFGHLQTHQAHAASWATDGKVLDGGTAVTTKLNTYVKDTAGSSRKVAYGVGGLGAVALGALAFFGRFQWGWFFGLIGGLTLIALYDIGLTSITGEGFDEAI